MEDNQYNEDEIEGGMEFPDRSEQVHTLMENFAWVILQTFVYGAFLAYVAYDVIQTFQIPALTELAYKHIYGIIIVLDIVRPNSVKVWPEANHFTWLISMVISASMFWGVAKIFATFFYLM